MILSGLTIPGGIKTRPNHIQKVIAHFRDFNIMEQPD